MNGIKIPKDILRPNDENIYEMRNKIYEKLTADVLEYITNLRATVSEAKNRDIVSRSVDSTIDQESFLLFYEGVEIPIMYKNIMILDGVEYIPTLQIVDRPIHSQKNGKFIIVKTNIRNSYVKLNGDEAIVNMRGGKAPLLPYLIYNYTSVQEMLKDLNIETVKTEAEAYYIVPDYLSKGEPIYIKKYDDKKWKGFLLAPYVKDNFQMHIEKYNISVTHQALLNEDLSVQKDDKKDDKKSQDIFKDELIDDDPDVKTNDGPIDLDVIVSKIKSEPKEDISDINEEIKSISEDQNKSNENMKLLAAYANPVILNKICNIILSYHSNLNKKNASTSTKGVTKIFVATNIAKLMIPDLTMENTSVYKIIIENIKADNNIPGACDIGDISQKIIRYMEWYAMKLTSVKSFPEKGMITEVAKIEQKLVYNNTLNPITELAMMSRVNLFGKGGLPRESCQSNVRNLHDSYYGVIDPISTPAGTNVGISLHAVPEINNTDLSQSVEKYKDDNIFIKFIEDINSKYGDAKREEN